MPFQVIATVVRRATSSENEVIYHDYLGFHFSFDQQVSIEELLAFGLAKLPPNHFTL